LREVLEALLVEVERLRAAPEERQERIRETLDREDPELPEGETWAMKLAKECLGDYPKEASLSLLGQERKIWATLEAFDCPEE
jgi:hypothetical protein